MKRTVNVDDLLCLITVKCSGEKHRVALFTNGSLAFFDHVDDQMKLEENLRMTGDLESSCTCAGIYRNWVGNNRWQLPEPLDNLRAEVAAGKHRPGRRHVDRRMQRGDAAKQDPLVQTTARQRAEARVLSKANEVFKRAEYRRGEYHHANDIKIVPRREALIKVENEARIKNEQRIVSTYFTLHLPLRWYVQVYKKGIALLPTKKGQVFVVDTLGPKRRDGSQLVRVILQSRGYKLKLVTALLTKRGALRVL